jgi:hypothetical protein
LGWRADDPGRLVWLVKQFGGEKEEGRGGSVFPLASELVHQPDKPAGVRGCGILVDEDTGRS